MFVPEQNDLVNANNTFDLPIGLVAGLTLLNFVRVRLPQSTSCGFCFFDPMSFPEQDV